MNAECTSFRRGDICADGFVQKPFCSGRVGCPTCGNISDKATPFCLKDEMPKHMITDDGKPLFYRAPNGEVRGASRPAGEASSAEGATSTVVLERTAGKEKT